MKLETELIGEILSKWTLFGNLMDSSNSFFYNKGVCYLLKELWLWLAKPNKKDWSKYESFCLNLKFRFGRDYSEKKPEQFYSLYYW